MNFTRASNSIVRGIRERVSRSIPPGRLVEDSVKQVKLPGTQHEATLFIFQTGDVRVFIAEVYSRDNKTRIYQSAKLPAPHSKWKGGAEADARDISKIMLTAIRDLAVTVANDPRFKPSVIVLNGHALNHSIEQIDASKNKL
jgi:hypothetical protein